MRDTLSFQWSSRFYSPCCGEKTDKAYLRCKVTSNHRMLICVACRNGDVPAKICVKSLEKEGVSVLHENLRLKRKERGLSQEELASRLHVVRQTISKWEKGMSVPDSEQLIKIAVILETTVSELLGTKVENEEEPDRLAKELSRINTQLAIRNHRTRRVLKIIAVALLVFVALIFAIMALNYGVFAEIGG